MRSTQGTQNSRLQIWQSTNVQENKNIRKIIFKKNIVLQHKSYYFHILILLNSFFELYIYYLNYKQMY